MSSCSLCDLIPPFLSCKHHRESAFVVSSFFNSIKGKGVILSNILVKNMKPEPFNFKYNIRGIIFSKWIITLKVRLFGTLCGVKAL